MLRWSCLAVYFQSQPQFFFFFFCIFFFNFGRFARFAVHLHFSNSVNVVLLLFVAFQRAETHTHTQTQARAHNLRARMVWNRMVCLQSGYIHAPRTADDNDWNCAIFMAAGDPKNHQQIILACQIYAFVCNIYIVCFQHKNRIHFNHNERTFLRNICVFIPFVKISIQAS